jgi:hypothetical protein
LTALKAGAYSTLSDAVKPGAAVIGSPMPRVERIATPAEACFRLAGVFVFPPLRCERCVL